MAQLLTPAGPDPGRISQILPTVKCSSCNQPVPIAELGDHVCLPPPTPAANAKPPMSPSSASFMQSKYQNIIASRPATPQTPQGPPRSRSVSVVPPPPAAHPGHERMMSLGPATPPLRVRAPSTASLNALGARPERVPSPLARGQSPDKSRVAFPTQPGSSENPARVPSPLSLKNQESAPVRSPTSSSASSRKLSKPEQPMAAQNMLRTPAQVPTRVPSPSAPTPPVRASSTTSQYNVRQPVQSTPAQYAPLSPPAAARSPSPSQRPRATSSLDTNVAQAQPAAQSMNMPPPPAPLRGASPGPNVAPSTRRPSIPTVSYSPHMIPMGGVIPPQSIASPPPTGQTPPPLEIDTKTGGEAGMAGVGRRGFQAAARAAMFAHQGGMQVGSPVPPTNGVFLTAQIPGMDGRRPNLPHYLDIASASNYATTNTPPLSADSGSSPHSPYSQHSPISADGSSPSYSGRTSVTPTQPAIARTPSPSVRSERSFINKDRVLPPALEPPKAPLPELPKTPTTPSLPFFEKFKREHLPAINPVDPEAGPLSPQESESEYGGLAYADSTDDEGDTVSNAGTAKPQRGKVRFPSMSAKSHNRSESKYSLSSSSAASPHLPMRSLSQSTSYTVRSAAKSTGALDRAMETLFEEDATSLAASSISTPAVYPLALGHDLQRDSMRMKLPTRSHTSPGLGPNRPESRSVATGKKKAAAKARVCLKCEKTIEDGRWIQMEGGGVMCGECWKNMYLPKCRRCNQTIEKQAVSSSDGQLKGKYHKECFNCHTCHKPFPDKSFYVFDGKPFCAYHYHETNKSLCAAATCGQPIEGPCAVSYSGDRYHPEHLLCEHPRCNERLVEYWEVDGRMFCEKHANSEMEDEDDEDDVPLGSYQPRGDSSTRATRRVTRFIDLGSGAFGLGARAGAEDDNNSS